MYGEWIDINYLVNLSSVYPAYYKWIDINAINLGEFEVSPSCILPQVSQGSFHQLWNTTQQTVDIRTNCHLTTNWTLPEVLQLKGCSPDPKRTARMDFSLDPSSGVSDCRAARWNWKPRVGGFKLDSSSPKIKVKIKNVEVSTTYGSTIW